MTSRKQLQLALINSVKIWRNSVFAKYLPMIVIWDEGRAVVISNKYIELLQGFSNN